MNRKSIMRDLRYEEEALNLRVFYIRELKIEDGLLRLSEDAKNILTDDEWKSCAKAIEKFEEELNKVMEIVYPKMEEVGIPLYKGE